MSRLLLTAFAVSPLIRLAASAAMLTDFAADWFHPNDRAIASGPTRSGIGSPATQSWPRRRPAA